jgi:hypothetical protein
MAGSISCGLEKAFNSVNHNILLPKLPFYQIKGRLNYYLNLIFRIDIKEFKFLTRIVIQTQSRNGLK